MENQKRTLAKIIIACEILSLLFLFILHLLSPEFGPSWRMVSEYALGKQQWALSLFFILWGVSSISLGALLWNIVTTRAAKIGVILLFVSGVGSSSTSIFDIEHSLHGLSGFLGIPTVIAASLLITYHLKHKENWKPLIKPIILNVHLTRISLLLMVVTMVLMITGFQNAGIEFKEGSEPSKSVPEGVIALGGYANRILIIVYIFWLILVAKTNIKVPKQ